jgi:Na+/melibiose symporter-like transporter
MGMGVAFIAIERRSRDPLLPFRMLRNAWLALALIVAFLFMATFGALLYFLSIYFQDVLHYDALQTGLTFLPPTTVVVIASALAGRVVTKIGSAAHDDHRSQRRCTWRAGGRIRDITERVFFWVFAWAHRGQCWRWRHVHNHVHRCIHWRT